MRYGSVCSGIEAATVAWHPLGWEPAVHKIQEQGWAVRRLLPTECEALQGFPRNHTQVEYRGKPAADGPRYKAIGNSMAVNVMRWIGQRIQFVDDFWDLL